jgi:hypothetical protein
MAIVMIVVKTSSTFILMIEDNISTADPIEFARETVEEQLKTWWAQKELSC